MSFNESDFQSLFTKYVKTSLPITAAFELKITKLKTLSYKRLEPHQETALLKAKHECKYHKISDLGAMGGALPFDAIQICNSNAYVVILFYAPRKAKMAYLIDIDRWINKRDSSSKKSITEPEAMQIAQFSVAL